MRARLAWTVLACGMMRAAAAQQADAGDFAPLEGEWHGRLEAKRQNTSRGTPEESTKTTLRVETFFDSPIAFLRVDFPFPDEKHDFEGSPFDPEKGDLKVRAGFRALKAAGYSCPSYVELTFPTADPKDAGTGKYQLGAGIRMLVPFKAPFADASAHAMRFETELSQTASFGGDPARADINYTKLELTVYDLWRERYTFKLKLKPAYDYVKSDDGAVGEIEAGFFFGEKRSWRTWLMLGRRLWGPQGISSTYDDRLEIGVNRTF
jgi:hypothetical protein